MHADFALICAYREKLKYICLPFKWDRCEIKFLKISPSESGCLGSGFNGGQGMHFDAAFMENWPNIVFFTILWGWHPILLENAVLQSNAFPVHAPAMDAYLTVHYFIIRKRDAIPYHNQPWWLQVFWNDVFHYKQFCQIWQIKKWSSALCLFMHQIFM